MDIIKSNDKLDLALATFRKIAQTISETNCNLPEVVPVLLIGGGALESYDIRESGEDIDLFLPKEFWRNIDLDEISNSIMQDNPIYQKLQSKIENPDEQQVIEMVGDRDLYTEMDVGNFENLVEPIETLEINGTKFEFKLPDLATIALSKSNSFRPKDIKDICSITERIGIERVMMEANRLIPLHGDHRVGDFVKEGLSSLATHLTMNGTVQYNDFVTTALNCLNLSSDVMVDLYSSFGVEPDINQLDEVWPSNDWEPDYDSNMEIGSSFYADDESFDF